MCYLCLQDMAGAHAVLDDAFLATYMLDAQCTRAEAYLRLKNEGSRQVCQYQFRKNDIVWICKQCQRDETCVLCNDCFPFSAHDGHEVFFYHSQAGGCCDCGDPGAWDPAGFCHRHGKVHESPVKDLPQGLLTTGRSVISSMSAYLENYSVSHAALFDIDHFLATPQPEIDPDTKLPLLYSLAVKSGDVHTPDEIGALLAVAMLPITPSQRGRMVLELMRDGSVVVATAQYSVISEYLGRLQSLADGPKLVVSVDKVNSKDERKGQFLINCISWLIKLAGISDGICAFICSTLPVERLRRIMVADCYLPEAVIKPFHELLLMLMADISFKRVIAGAYALALPETTQKYGDGVGMSELSVFRISVQFLNRYVFVSEIVHKYSFLENLASGLLRMMRSSSSTHHDSIFDRSMYTLKHHVIKHRRYDAILGDLKIIFILPTIPKIFCMNCLDTLLDAVETMQYIDPQVRNITIFISE